MTKEIIEQESRGWICMHRKLLLNPISNRSDYLALWVHLLLMANREETSFIWNNKKQTLKAGQLLTGRKKLSEKTGIAESQIYKILKYLEKEQQIEQQKTTKFTVITIVNWGKYQDKEQQKEQQSNNRVTTEQQQSNTYNNINNINNINKERGKTPTLKKEVKTLHWIKTHKTEVLENLKKNYPDKNAEKAYEYFLKRMEIKSYGYKDYLKALQDWVREDRFNQFNLKGGTKGANQIAPEGKYSWAKKN